MSGSPQSTDMHPLARIRFRARRAILDSDFLAVPYMSIRREYSHRRLRDGVRLVADGFPRSANSYFMQAYILAEGTPDAFAGHAHSAGLMRAAVRRNIPTVLLIREPSSVLASYVQFEEGVAAADILRAYLGFHHALRPILSKIVVADFAEVIANPGGVMGRARRISGAEFAVYQRTEENEQAIRERLDAIDARRNNGATSERTVSRPSASRKPANEVVAALSSRERSLLAEAQDLYSLYIRQSSHHPDE